MAASITIKTDIAEYTPVYNRMELCVVADAGSLALTGMQYIFDVYIESISSPAYKRFQVPKDPVLSYGVVDISRYCESAVNNTMSVYNSVVPFSLGANANGTQSIIKVTIKYGISYYLAGVYTVTPDILTGSAKYAFNGSLDNQDFYNLITVATFGTKYLLNTSNGSAGQFITDQKTNNVSISNLGWHHILSDVPTDVDRLVVVTYNASGGVIQTAIKAISVAQNVTASKMYKVATSPKTLNNMTGAFVSGAQPLITASVASYEIYLTNSAGVVVSETLTFEIEEPCRYTQRRLHFLNRFGSFDSFNFNSRSQRSQDTSRKTYKYNPYPLVAAGISRSFTEQSQVVNFTDTQDKMILRSDFITTEENEWLKQLISSPEIYLEELDGAGVANLTSIESVTSTSWLERETEIDKLFIMEVEIKFGQKNYRQRR